MIIVFWISLIILPTCSMNPETSVTCTHGHFNWVVFAVHVIMRYVVMKAIVVYFLDTGNSGGTEKGL